MSQGDGDLVPTPLGVRPTGRTEAMAREGTKKSPKRKGGSPKRKESDAVGRVHSWASGWARATV